MRAWKALLATFFISASSYAGATVITYDVTQLDAATHTWQYDFTVSNDTLSSDLGEFAVFFDVNLYSNLALVASPPGWDSLLVQPDPLLPDDGFLDSLALGAGIAPGGSLGGFSVSFVFAGAGAPGAQAFSIYDANFNSIDAGRTSSPVNGTVPEPATMLLFALALASLLAGMRSRTAKPGT